DSVPERRALLTVTAPSFTGTGAVNTGFGRLMLVDPSMRERSQAQIADYLSANFSKLNNARVFAFQQQTIQVGFRAGLPVQFIIQAPDFDKLKEAVPKFMQAASADPVF